MAASRKPKDAMFALKLVLGCLYAPTYFVLNSQLQAIDLLNALPLLPYAFPFALPFMAACWLAMKWVHQCFKVSGSGRRPAILLISVALSIISGWLTAALVNRYVAPGPAVSVPFEGYTENLAHRRHPSYRLQPLETGKLSVSGQKIGSFKLTVWQYKALAADRVTQMTLLARPGLLGAPIGVSITANGTTCLLSERKC